MKDATDFFFSNGLLDFPPVVPNSMASSVGSSLYIASPSLVSSLHLPPFPRGLRFLVRLYPTSGSVLRSLTNLQLQLVWLDLPFSSRWIRQGISLYSSYVAGTWGAAGVLASLR